MNRMPDPPFDPERRQVLGLLGATAATVLLGGVPQAATSSRTPGCIVRPEQTEGPYFIDEKLNRSDLRADPADGTLREGVPLRLAFQLSQILGERCRPLPGAAVDLWHCDALGVYSDVLDAGGAFDTRGKKFLRGYQLTDASGKAEFLTIFPGWYEGRAVHLHFKIRTQAKRGSGHEFTSQLYFDEGLLDRIHAQAPYASKGRRDTPNARDGIYRRGGSQLLLPVIQRPEGYLGTLDLGLRLG